MTIVTTLINRPQKQSSPLIDRLIVKGLKCKNSTDFVINDDSICQLLSISGDFYELLMIYTASLSLCK